MFAPGSPRLRPAAPRAGAAVLVPLLLALLVALAAPALAGGDLETVAAALRRDPVFVDPSAERAFDDGEADALRRQIQESGEPIFIAVLPESFVSGSTSVNDLPIDLAEATGLSGTYAVIAGDSFRAASNAISGADAAATEAFQRSSGGGAAAVLADFVDTVASGRSSGSGGGSGSGSGAGSRDDGEGGSALPVLLLLGAGGGALVYASRRRRRREAVEDERAWRADAELLRAELSVVGDDVLRLQPQVSINPAAAQDFDAAVERHRAASAALDQADEAVDLIRVQRVVDEARYAMARARAILDGRTPPPPPDELRRPGRHQEPPIELDDRGEPVYAGGTAFYGGGGWFGGGGGLFSGLLLGSMLSGPFGWGWGGGFGGWGGGWGGHDHGHGDSGGDGGGFGDFGGGDWGGGGDFGGDIGGGDW